jgi:geranylgeranyl pyrophosphate synthase
MPQVEALMRLQGADQQPEIRAALESLLASGGKRVRPAVALLTGGMLGGEEGRLVTLAAAIEMLHTATLVHDDLIDGASLRRGNTTLNAQWSPAATVLTGDFIFARAAKLAAETDSLAVMRLFAETLATIVGGEITQLFTSRGLASRPDYERRIYAKTASMFELATAAAALLCPVEEPVVETARRFGHDIGMAFQIVDDVLDFTGLQATVGKPVASDLRQGLVTLPALYYLEAHPDDADIRLVLSSSSPNGVVMQRLVEAIRLSGAIQRAMGEAQDYVERSLQALAELPDNAPRGALEALARYIVDRPH